ncbi:MAG: hypothetical protein OEY44_00400 [Candidatus Peregrinibacteria bacterium]|nr:hypothetical protein [Candidatus Peregrinibacteria bacterium]
MQFKRFLSVELFLVVGLFYVFFLFGIQKFIFPEYWEGWIPMWMDGFLGISKALWNKLIGAAEVVMAIGLLFRQTRRLAALLMALHLLAIVYITRLSDIGIRDTGLLLMAVALVVPKK